MYQKAMEKGENIGLDELLGNQKQCNSFWQKKKAEKTTILQKIGLKYIDKYNELQIIPIHIDMRFLSKKLIN